MDLRDYLARENLTSAAFGRIIGVSRMTALRYAARDRVPKPAVMARIVRATKGAVLPNDFHQISDLMEERNAA